MSIRREDAARPALGTGKPVGARLFRGLGGQVVGVHDVFGFEFAVQDGEGAARFGVCVVVGKHGFEQVPFFFGIIGGLAEDETGFDARLDIVHVEQGALGVTARRGAVARLQVDVGFVDEFVIALHLFHSWVV